MRFADLRLWTSYLCTMKFGEFKLNTTFKPQGDQPKAIRKLVSGVKKKKFQTLLGVTGSGKTFSLAHVVKNLNRPTLIISHNKTLAAQLYAEFKDFFPSNAVEYFVSYYDYYQPEAYIPPTDTYIEKDSSINERLDRLRLSATSSLMARRDVLVVASVSCIFNLGSPEDYRDLVLWLAKDEEIFQKTLCERLTVLQYERNDYDFKRGTFRVKGDVVDIYPSYKTTAFRLEFFGDSIERISEINPVSGKTISNLEKIALYPAKHFLVSPEKIDTAVQTIRWETEDRLKVLEKQNKTHYAERLRKRTLYDLEMLKECGWCHGIENYSRHLSQREPGARPYCLLDYLDDDGLIVLDESHVTVPQIKGMYNQDKVRKEVLVEYGFRLPSCLDNRPLRFEEFMSLLKEKQRNTIFVSATPKQFEISLSGNETVEQVIRPTGLLDPVIEVRPTKNQIDDLIGEIKQRAKKNQRVLVTTLTKRMAEDLTSYLDDAGIAVQYLHSEIDTIDRAKILNRLRKKEFDCLVGINLLREGLDLPETSLVVILDADKEGFLRSAISLIQVSGRAARNLEGKVIMYADNMTNSMRKAIQESRRRRRKQKRHNEKYNITPTTVKKKIQEGIDIYYKAEEVTISAVDEEKDEFELREKMDRLQRQMMVEAKNLNFEKAVQLRDQVRDLEKKLKVKG